MVPLKLLSLWIAVTLQHPPAALRDPLHRLVGCDRAALVTKFAAGIGVTAADQSGDSRRLQILLAE